MARLPDALPLSPVEGVQERLSAPEPTDFGLGGLGQDLTAAAQLNREAQATVDQRTAEPMLLKLQNDNETAFQSESAAYTGENPGFAADQIAKAQQRANAVLANPDLTPGVRAQLVLMATKETTRVGQQAIDREAQARAAPIAQMQQAQDDVAINAALASQTANFAPAKQQLLNAYDGSQPGLTQSIADAWDKTAQDTLAATPDRYKGIVEQHLAAQRNQQIATAAEAETHASTNYVVKNTTDQANTLINTIASNPLAYDGVMQNDLPRLAALLPQGVRKDGLTELQGQASKARIEGLIDGQNAAQALTELNDGRYDAYLQPAEKEELIARATAASRETGPKTLDQWMAARDLEQRADAETFSRMTTGQSTGNVSLAEIAAKLSPEMASGYVEKWKQADQQYAAAGAVRDMPLADVAAQASAPPPDPADPAYASKLAVWQTQRQVAADELKARQDDPAAWAMQTRAPAKGQGAAASGQAMDRGAVLQQQWSNVATAQGPQRTAAGATYAASMLGVQEQAGVPKATMSLVPAAEAQRLAASVTAAPPEQKLAALQSLAGIVSAMPTAMRMQDGSYINPQAMLGRQLLASHLTQTDLSAIVDFGGNPAALARYVSALNDSTLKTPLPGNKEQQLKTDVASALKPYLASGAPLPGASELAQARIDRTVLIARSLMTTQGLNAATAAQQAAKQASTTASGDSYRFVDSWRMPSAQANASTGVFGRDGGQLAQIGAQKTLADLLANNGANLYQPTGRSGQMQNITHGQVQANAKWVTDPADTGLMLMAPNGNGGYVQLQDKWGRPIAATWSQLQARAHGHASPFATPPANAVKGPDGHPVPAVSRPAAFSALSWAVTKQESGFKSGQVSNAGALGKMQVMPATVATYAPRLGLPVDLDRAKNDDAYNQQIGNAALTDNLQHYGLGAGIGLALAAYNAGAGKLDGYTDKAGYHPGWLQTIGDPRKGQISLDDFVSRIPVKETRDYVKAVLPSALARLQGGG